MSILCKRPTISKPGMKPDGHEFENTISIELHEVVVGWGLWGVYYPSGSPIQFPQMQY